MVAPELADDGWLDDVEHEFPPFMEAFGGDPPADVMLAMVEILAHLGMDGFDDDEPGEGIRPLLQAAVLRRLSRRRGSVDGATWAALHTEASFWASYAGDDERMFAHLARAVAALPHESTEWVETSLRLVHALAWLRPRAALRRVTQEVWPVVEARGNNAEMARALAAHAEALKELDDPAAAIAILRDRLLPLLHALGDATALAEGYAALADAQRVNGQRDDALATPRRAPQPPATTP